MRASVSGSKRARTIGSIDGARRHGGHAQPVGAVVGASQEAAQQASATGPGRAQALLAGVQDGQQVVDMARHGQRRRALLRAGL